MGWRDWFRRRPMLERASGPPIDIIPRIGSVFGPGAQTQQTHEILLHENLGIAHAATRAIANRVASLELQVVTERRVTGGTTEEEILDDHPCKILLDRPHPNYTIRQLLGTITQWIVSTGEAYLVKVGNGLGIPVELHWLHPKMVEPIVNGGIVQAYRITDANGQQFTRPADTLIRIYFPDPENPWRSEGYLGPSAITLDGHKFLSETLRKYYQYDATPKVVFETNDPLAPAPVGDVLERHRQDWIQRYSGRFRGEDGGVPKFAAPGWKAHELNAAPAEAHRALMETWRDDLLMMMGGVPRSVLGQVVSGDRSSAEVNQWVFDMYAITPIALLIGDALTQQLAVDFEGDIKVRFAPFVSEDKDFELKREAQDLEHGVRTINRVLTDRQDDQVEWGEIPLMATNLGPYDPETALEAQKNAAKPPEPASGAEPDDPNMTDDAADRAERREHAAVRAKWAVRRKKAA